MNALSRKLSMTIMGASAFAAGMIWSGEVRPRQPGDLVSQAEAIIGRPVTPVSYAGVARRTTVRAAAHAPAAAATATAATATAATAGAAAAAPAMPAGCVRVTEPDGTSYTRCP